MNKLYKIAILFVVVSMVSCEKGLINFDNKQSDVYFSDAGKAIPAMAYDSMYLSFSYTEEPDTVWNVVVAVTGSPVDHDREYKIVVDDASTAIAGVHYDSLPQKLVIKKNELSDVIKLKLHRTPEMQTNSYIIILDLLANENFGNSWKTRLISGKTIKTTSTKIVFDDIIRKPKSWIDSYWGTFSRKKLFFVCDYLGITPQYMDTGITVAETTALPKIVQRYLNQLAAAGKTVYEDDGITVMKMGRSAQ